MKAKAVNRDRILICVTRQKTCEKLIEHGAMLADYDGERLFVVHSVRVGESFLGNPLEGEAMEYLYSASSRVGAEMTVLRSDDVIGAIVSRAKEIGATCLVLGHSPDKRKRFLVKLQSQLPDVRFEII